MSPIDEDNFSIKTNVLLNVNVCYFFSVRSCMVLKKVIIPSQYVIVTSSKLWNDKWFWPPNSPPLFHSPLRCFYPFIQIINMYVWKKVKELPVFSLVCQHLETLSNCFVKYFFAHSLSYVYFPSACCCDRHRFSDFSQ